MKLESYPEGSWSIDGITIPQASCLLEVIHPQIPVLGMDTHPGVLTRVHDVHTTQGAEEFPSHSWKMALCRKQGI